MRAQRSGGRKRLGVSQLLILRCAAVQVGVPADGERIPRLARLLDVGRTEVQVRVVVSVGDQSGVPSSHNEQATRAGMPRQNVHGDRPCRPVSSRTPRSKITVFHDVAWASTVDSRTGRSGSTAVMRFITITTRTPPRYRLATTQAEIETRVSAIGFSEPRRRLTP